MWSYLGHLHLGCPTTADHAGILHGLLQHAQRVVQGSLSLIQHMRAYRDQVRQGSNSPFACGCPLQACTAARPLQSDLSSIEIRQ